MGKFLKNEEILEFFWDDKSQTSSSFPLKPLEVGLIHLWYGRRRKEDLRSGVQYFHNLIEKYNNGRYRLLRNENGKPILEKIKADTLNLALSISHTDDLIVVAFAYAHNLGLDVEKLREVSRSEKVAKRYFSEQEFFYIFENAENDEILRNHRFVQIWTLKEALIKSQGGNLLLDIKEAELNIGGPDSTKEICVTSANWPQIILNSRLKSSPCSEKTFSYYQAIAVEF